MRVKTTFAVLALAALALGLPASSAANGSRVVHVDAGESIQAAIDKAKPYTTIKVAAGTYAESLLIDKDGIRLVGEGRKKTKIVPPASPTPGEGCAFPADGGAVIVHGICVTDSNAQGEIVHRVEDVHISHLSVSDFHIGIFYLGTEDGVVTRVITADNEEYGIFANDSSGTTIARNVTSNENPDVAPDVPGNQLPEAGIYVGDSPHADATVWKNVSYGQLLGIFIRDAVGGHVVKNKSFSNCVGFLFLNTDAPVDTGNWLAKHNNATANSKACDPVPGEEAPPLSGVGIAVLGGHDIDLIDNGVFGNKPVAGFQSAFQGGIVVVTSPFGAQPVPSTGIKVAFNTAIGNDPDLLWDEQGTGNVFFRNDCLTSQPDGLCEDPDENGDGEHGDDDDDRGNGHPKGDRDDRDDKRKHAKHKKHKKKHHKHHKKHDRDDD